MKRRRNRWHVYEHMKQSYMFGGRVPTQQEIMTEFGTELDPEEIAEGVAEFVITVKRFVPHIQMEQVVGQ